MSTDIAYVEELLNRLKKDKFFVIPALQVMAYEDHDPDAPYQLGLMYYTMPGKDPKGALPWFLISSSRNGSKGDFMLGEMYRKGKGVERDCLVSLQWHLKAAKDNMHSWIKIAHLLYRGGEGVPKDNYKALAWFYRHDPQSRMVKHLNERHCHLKETDKNGPFSDLYKDTQSILYIALGKREKEKRLLERADNIKTYKHRKPTRDEVEDMTQCSKAFTKKEMKKVFNPFFFQPKRK